jgi:hypothetical protein
MESILLYLFGFMVVMTLILWMMPNRKINAIGNFFAVVLPKIPLVGMIKAYFDSKNKNNNSRS